MTITTNGQALPSTERAAISQAYPTHVHVEEFALTHKGAERAKCNLLINGAVILKSVRLMQAPKGYLYVSMPSERSFGIEKPLAHAVSPELKQRIRDMVTELYHQEMQLMAQQSVSRENQATDHLVCSESQAAVVSGFDMQSPSM